MRKSHTNISWNRWWFNVFRNGKKTILHMWQPKYYSHKYVELYQVLRYQTKANYYLILDHVSSTFVMWILTRYMSSCDILPPYTTMIEDSYRTCFCQNYHVLSPHSHKLNHLVNPEIHISIVLYRHYLSVYFVVK